MWDNCRFRIFDGWLAVCLAFEEQYVPLGIDCDIDWSLLYGYSSLLLLIRPSVSLVQFVYPDMSRQFHAVLYSAQNRNDSLRDEPCRVYVDVYLGGNLLKQNVAANKLKNGLPVMF